MAAATSSGIGIGGVDTVLGVALRLPLGSGRAKGGGGRDLEPGPALAVWAAL
jgi:hypothetical protein